MLGFTARNEVWLAGEQYLPGEHEVGRPTKEQTAHAAAAHATGDIEVTEGLDETHVQSQEDAEAAYKVAQGEWVPISYGKDGQAIPGYWSGGWRDGNVLQYRLEQAQAAVTVAEENGDTEALADAEAELGRVEKDIKALGGGKK